MERTFEAALGDLLSRGRASFPTVRLASAAFKRYAAVALKDVGAGALRDLHAADLYLAAAAALGDSEAVRIIDEQFVSMVPAYLKKAGIALAAEEVQQLLRARLFVAEDGTLPLITKFSGQGALGGWLRVVSVRLARDLLRSAGRRREQPLGSGSRPAGGRDAEAELIRREHEREFRFSFGRAIQGLSADDRNMLSMHFVEGLTTDAIGKLLRVDGSTVRRRIAKARGTVLARVESDLKVRLGLAQSALRSMLAQVRSQLDITITAALRGKTSK